MGEIFRHEAHQIQLILYQSSNIRANRKINVLKQYSQQNIHHSAIMPT